MTAIIRDMAGTQIASVQLSPPSDAQSITVERVIEGKGALLNYYFCRGQRQVTIESEMFQLSGVLKTHWEKNERKWRVCPDPVLALAAVSIGTDDQERG